MATEILLFFNLIKSSCQNLQGIWYATSYISPLQILLNYGPRLKGGHWL